MSDKIKEIYEQIQQANIEAVESDTTAEALDELF